MCTNSQRVKLSKGKSEQVMGPGYDSVSSDSASYLIRRASNNYFYLMNEYQEGISALHNDELEKSIALFDIAIGSKVKEADSLFAKAVALDRLGKNTSAMQCFESLISKHPSNSDGYLGKARMLTTIGKYEEALVMHKKALQLNEGAWQCWEGKGYTLNKMKKYSESLICYEQAITRNPHNDPISYIGRADTLCELKNYTPAIKDIHYAELALDTAHTQENLSLLQMKILREGIESLKQLNKTAKEMKQENKITLKDYDRVAKEAIKVLNKSYRLHNYSHLTTGMSNIRQALEGDSEFGPLIEAQEEMPLCQCTDQCRLF